MCDVWTVAIHTRRTASGHVRKEWYESITRERSAVMIQTSRKRAQCCWRSDTG
jgi:hypothetical protein